MKSRFSFKTYQWSDGCQKNAFNQGKQNRDQLKDAPYANTNIEVTIAICTVLVIPNSFAMVPVAGATIEDDTGLIKVNNDTIAVAAHLSLNFHLKGNRSA